MDKNKKLVWQKEKMVQEFSIRKNYTFTRGDEIEVSQKPARHRIPGIRRPVPDLHRRASGHHQSGAITK